MNNQTFPSNVKIWQLHVLVLLQTTVCLLPTISSAQKIAAGAYHSLSGFYLLNYIEENKTAIIKLIAF